MRKSKLRGMHATIALASGRPIGRAARDIHDEDTLPSAPNPLRVARARQRRQYADTVFLALAIGAAVAFVWAVWSALS